MPTAPRRLIVCESSTSLQVAVRRWLPERVAELECVRSTAEVVERLPNVPASLVMLELTADGLADGLELLALSFHRFPFSRTTVIATPETAAYGPLALELGALHFQVGAILDMSWSWLAARHWSVDLPFPLDPPTTDPPPTWADETLASLPWNP